MSFFDLLNEINYPEYRKKYNEVLTFGDANKSRKFRSSYISQLCIIFRTYPIEKIYAVIDFLRNNDYQLYFDLIKTHNPIVMRVVVLFKELNYISFQDIKYNKENAVDFEHTKLSLRGVNASTGKRMMDVYFEEYKIISDYLQNYSDEAIRTTLLEDEVSFYKRLGNVADVLFFQDDLKNERQNIIERLFQNRFLKEKLGNDTLTRIFNDVLLKNKRLDSFNYNNILCDYFGCENVRDIKGMFRKCNGDFFYRFAKGFYVHDNPKKWMGEFLKGVVETNKGDEIGLALFFSQLNVYLSKSYKRYLKRFDFYNYYSNIDIERIYSDAINKLIVGENIDPMIRDTIGLCDMFINKYNYFKDLFCKTDNPVIRENLITPLAVGLAEIERRKYDLEYHICLSNDVINNFTYGNYSKARDTMYLNPFLSRMITDKKLAYASISYTVFHEVKHARQMSIIGIDKPLNIDYLLMAIDCFLADIVPGYYKHEYARLSFEVDAENTAFNETMKFFEGYPEMQHYVMQSHNNQVISKKRSLSSKIIRSNPMESNETYNVYGIVELLIKCSNWYIKKEGFKNFYNKFNDYPILSQFFEIDFSKEELVTRSKNYFDTLLKKYEKEPNQIQREDAIYAIKMFNFIINIENEMHFKDKIEVNLRYRNDMEVFDDESRIPRR